MEALEAADIIVEGTAKDIDEYSGREAVYDDAPLTLFHTHRSPPLKRLIRIVNKSSQNFYADMILKTLGAEFKPVGGFDTGASVVREFLADIGMPGVGEFSMRDGSGLSRRNLVQPRQSTHLLRFMKRHLDGEYFYDSLPIAGVDGTISNRMKSKTASGNVHAKTGFITFSRCLSGYITTVGGDEIVFSMMANNYTVPTRKANAIQDKAVNYLAGLQ